MIVNLCTYPVKSDIFASSVHPHEPLIALGLASGHVQLLRLPTGTNLRSGKGTIETIWQTRRHKGSCRVLGFSTDGSTLFSAGTDGIIKIADAKTGFVQRKLAIPTIRNGQIDAPTALRLLTPQTLLVAADSGLLHVFDLSSLSSTSTPRNVSLRPQQTIKDTHLDYITSLLALPPSKTSTSGLSRQWLSTGGSTVAISDIRKGIIIQGEDQDEELLSAALVADGTKVVVGGERGILRIWDVGVWDDSEVTINVGNGASADIIASPDGQFDPNVPIQDQDEDSQDSDVDSDEGHSIEKNSTQLPIAIGCDDGTIKFITISGNRPRLIESVRHDDIDGVTALAWCHGLLASGGGQVLKIWAENESPNGELQTSTSETQQNDGHAKVKPTKSIKIQGHTVDLDDENANWDELLQTGNKSKKRSMKDVAENEEDEKNENDSDDEEEQEEENKPLRLDPDHADDSDSDEDENRQQRRKRKKKRRRGGSVKKEDSNGIMYLKGLD